MSELNPSELRIGNIVTIDNPKFHPTLNGVPLVITGINKRVYNWELTYEVQLEHINQEPNRYYDTFSQFIKYVKPIPLTEEILLKCGFEPKYFGIKTYYNPLMDLDHDLMLMNVDYGIKVESLHQLQNLYYSLTGEELLKDIIKSKSKS